MSYFERREQQTVFVHRQVLAIPMLACGVPKTEVAQRLHVSKACLSGWLKDETFCLAIAHEQRRMVEELQAQIRAIGDEAVQAVREVLNDRKASPRARLRAAEIVLNRLDRFQDLTANKPLPALSVYVDPAEDDDLDAPHTTGLIDHAPLAQAA